MAQRRDEKEHQRRGDDGQDKYEQRMERSKVFLEEKHLDSSVEVKNGGDALQDVLQSVRRVHEDMGKVKTSASNE